MTTMLKKLVNYRGALDSLILMLEQNQLFKVLLVTGRNSFENSEILTGFHKALNEKASVYRFFEFNTNPTIFDLEKGILFAQNFNPDVVIGIGGGSVMDIAKLVSKFSHINGDLENIIKTNQVIYERKKKLVLVPTTAGSGSEATHFSVVYINDNKYSYASSDLIPDSTILDSRLIDSMSRRQSGISALDAFCQAIESYWSVDSTIESRKLSEMSLKLITSNFMQFLENSTPQVSDNMLYASFLSGSAINITKTTAPHALSYYLTKKYDIPHGHAVSLFLPYFLRFNSVEIETNLSNGLNFIEYKSRFSNLLKILGVSDVNSAINLVYRMQDHVPIERNLSDVGVKSLSDIEKIADAVNLERLKNNPKKVSKQNLLNLLNKS